MRSIVRHLRGPSRSWLLASLAAVAALPGCNRTDGPRADQIEQADHLPNKVPVAKFAGHVSVDGQPSSQEGTLFVILNDPQHLVRGGKAYTNCDEQGNFAFTTYLPGDGAPTGKYVVTFVQFHLGGGADRGSRLVRSPGVPGMMSQEYVGPDGLNNLYNDPEKNKDNPNFVVQIADPGRTDYDFNLELAGKEPVKTQRAYAATKLRTAIVPKL
ncbi:MAG TPA: hypothetical protein VG055_07435 [Planctomycetaceae bacterium]|nr:hypothetical protein [Planctomycetaceae bacterium]